MSTVLKAVFGIGIAVVLYILILLGVQAFYPAPDYQNFCNQSEMYYQPVNYGYEKCLDNMTVGECRASMNLQSNEEQIKCQKDYDDASKHYNKNFFIIASIIGALVLISSYFFLRIPNISAGISCSGIILIFWAFVRGWDSTDTKLKFIIALVITIIVITLTVLVNKKFSQHHR